jgi:hypothetical protein
MAIFIHLGNAISPEQNPVYSGPLFAAHLNVLIETAISFLDESSLSDRLTDVGSLGY